MRPARLGLLWVRDGEEAEEEEEEEEEENGAPLGVCNPLAPSGAAERAPYLSRDRLPPSAVHQRHLVVVAVNCCCIF
ncbi:uncharacterized protein V6R79_019205 [Siganus canaliculatus]